MAISISEQIRDNVISDKMLEKARTDGLPARLRTDAHRTVDLIADIGSILYNSALTFLEKYAAGYAEKSFEEVLKIDPQHPDARVGMARVTAWVAVSTSTTQPVWPAVK